MVNNRHPPTMSKRHVFGNAAIGNLNDVNFQFEFPKFGQLPGPISPANTSSGNGRSSASPQTIRTPSDQFSPLDNSTRQNSSTSSHINGLDRQAKEDLAKFSGIFSPPLTNKNVATAARNSTDSHASSGATNTSSPSCSPNSNAGPSSSCGTSPEPTNQSPMSFKPDALTTIGEENHSTFAQPHGKNYLVKTRSPYVILFGEKKKEFTHATFDPRCICVCQPTASRPMVFAGFFTSFS